jgi:ParB family chromosome partitioning protein
MAAPMQKSRLGRGLASLIGEPTEDQPKLPPEGDHRVLSIELLRSGQLNPRQDFKESDLEELANSIRQKGLVQPILARVVPGVPGYEIVAGERRWRAAQRAGLHAIPVIVRELADKEVLELAIIENVQRADLNAMEEAQGYQDLIDRYGYTQETLSDVIGKSRSHLANTVRLLKLPARVQEFVSAGQLTAGHARALVGRSDAEALAVQIVDGDLNVRQAEALVQASDVGDKTQPPRGREKDADTLAFERELSDALGLKVEIKRGSGESGKLTVRFGNYDQLDYIKMRLVGSGA